MLAPVGTTLLPLAAFGSLLGPDFLLVAVIGLVTTAFWLWMLVDCLTNQRLGDTEKIIWVLVLLFSHVIGATLYFFIARGKAGRPGI